MQYYYIAGAENASTYSVMRLVWNPEIPRDKWLVPTGL